MELVRRARLPDEKGTEMYQLLVLGFVLGGRARLPDEKGTEMCHWSMSATGWNRAARGSPMRRGLKCNRR